MTVTGLPAGRATRHYCSLRDHPGAGWRSGHTVRNGKPRSQWCTYCHGALIIETGLWGAFGWDGSGSYPLENAVRTFTSETRADAPPPRCAPPGSSAAT
jgi:hypothetical protein